MNDKNLPTQPQYTIFITDGPHDARRAPTASSCYPDPDRVRRQLQTALEHQDEEVFRIMIGALCLSVRNPDQTFDIEPLLIVPLPLGIQILHLCDEPASPDGVCIVGRVTSIMDYCHKVPDYYQLISNVHPIRIGSIVQLSYNLTSCVGGITPVISAHPQDHRPPLINSLSGLFRKCLAVDDHPNAIFRGRSIYRVTSTEYDAPVGFDPIAASFVSIS